MGRRNYVAMTMNIRVACLYSWPTRVKKEKGNLFLSAHSAAGHELVYIYACMGTPRFEYEPRQCWSPLMSSCVVPIRCTQHAYNAMQMHDPRMSLEIVD